MPVKLQSDHRIYDDVGAKHFAVNQMFVVMHVIHSGIWSARHRNCAGAQLLEAEFDVMNMHMYQTSLHCTAFCSGLSLTTAINSGVNGILHFDRHLSCTWEPKKSKGL